MSWEVQAHENMCRKRIMDALVKTTEETERVERTNAMGRDKKNSLTWTRVLAIARRNQEEMTMCRWLEDGGGGS